MAKEVIYRTFDLDIEVREAKRQIEALIPYNSDAQIGSFTERFAPGAFARSARERGDRIPVLYQHQSDDPPVGSSVKLTDTRDGLLSVLSIAHTDRGDEVLSLAAGGHLSGISPGFQIPAGGDRWSTDGAERTITEAKLIELSLTPFPAYTDARVLSVRSVADALAALDALDHPDAPPKRGRSLLLATRGLQLLEMNK